MKQAHYRALVFLLILSQIGFGGERKSEYRLRAQLPDGWEIEYTPTPRDVTRLEIERKTYIRFSGPTKTSDGTGGGSPALPVDALILGIPDGATLSAEILNPVYESTESPAVSPQPDYEYTPEQEAVEQFKPNLAIYTRNQFIPSNHIEVEPPFLLRKQRASVVRLRPYQYNPATGTLRRLVSATVRIRMQGSSAKLSAAAGSSASDPYFEDTYKSLIWNYDQAKAWRIGAFRSTTVLDPTAIWFETGRNYFKALIANDGWYKLSKTDLEAAGGSLAGVDLSTLKIFARGVQIPIVVRPDSTVEFHAFHKYGDSTYIDYYTDTSAYWLTWGQSEGVRFTPVISAGLPTSTILSSQQTIHFEQNLALYSGTTVEEQFDVNTVPGEGFYWRSFNVNTVVNFPFSLDSIAIGASTATIRARMWGTGYVNPPNPPAQHKARFWLNDSLVGDADFGQRQAGLLNATVPTSWLRVGDNTLRVQSISTGTGGNTFYLDWFEVDYPRALRAVNDQLSFVSPASSGGSPAEFVVGGFSNAAIEVFNLTSRRSILGGTVSGDSVSGFSIAFRDTFSAPQTYVAFCSGSQRTIPALKLRVFANIRNTPAGADYIVISHNNFLPYANQLALHRQNTNGVRTKVVDIESIYDEFNYGVTNATTIKTFLKYAFDNWAAPAVSYVVLLGDASWDFHRYFSNTIKTNFVPAYGIPTGDNWFACFDTTHPFLPSLYIGRLPAENTTHAQSLVNKIIGYDSYELSDWNKNYLFISGGVNQTEVEVFNSFSNGTMNTYITPAPLGGRPFHVFRTTPGYIDGEHTRQIQNLWKNGLVFVNFLGHSGGRVWGVDPGPAEQFENTNGRLPFVSSVSCNVGGFATPSNRVFAEDLVNVDNRGAIAAWASSSLGFATYGSLLTNDFLSNATADSVREFGKLTANACYRLWSDIGSFYITIAMCNLNPLLGDPMSRLAVPRKADLAIASSDIVVNKTQPTPSDSSLTVNVRVHNYGLVPPDSVGVTVTDVYNGQTTYLVNNVKLPATKYADSISFSWNGSKRVGMHTLVANVDPANSIGEVNELNNIASKDQYTYTNNIYAVRPLNNMVVPPGVQRLVVTSPIGYDSSGFTYTFELDTVDTFDSPARISSGPISPDNAKGEWLTPALPAEKLYFWRARTMHGSLAGNWLTSAFTTSSDLPLSPDANAPLVRIRERTRKQFGRDAVFSATATDSGVIIAPQQPLTIFARSLGSRLDVYREYYSIVQVNDQRIVGVTFDVGNSFLVARVNDFTGDRVFRFFDVRASVALADSMKNFINTTPVGNYLAISVITNGQSNVTEGLKQAMDSLGATLFRSILVNQSYAFIGRKGNGAPGMTPLEQLTNDSAVVSLTVPNFYSAGSGSVLSSLSAVPQSWDSLHWRWSGDVNATNPRLALLGVRAAGGTDTIRILAKDTLDVGLSNLDPVTSGPRYSSIAVAGLLSTSNANLTPRLTDWWIDCTLPPDLAVSARSLGQSDANTFNFPITVYNFGYRKSDSVRVVVNALDKYNVSHQVASTRLDSIPVDESRSVIVPISTAGFNRKTILQVVVSPLKKGRDLIAENNTAYYTLYTPVGIATIRLRVYADGNPVMDGDYVAAKPTIIVRKDEADLPSSVSQYEMLVDKKTFISSSQQSLAKGTGAAGDQVFTPDFTDGEHELRFRVASVNVLGEADTLEQTLRVNVNSATRLLQVYPYPNPFRTDTYFTFVVTGSRVPEEVRIRVFTIAGRKINELVRDAGSLRVGYNRVYWDGRDADGDEVANGYYLYEVLVKSNGRTESSIQKLAKVR
jgi:hypothetical protein